VAELAGKIIMDADNYYPARDGHIAALDWMRQPPAACCRTTFRSRTW
jgi:hypothetical protein